MKIIFSLLLLVGLSQAFVCPDNYCDTVKCDDTGPETCGRDRWVKGGGLCGCCDVCIKQLGHKESCGMSGLLGTPATSECSFGLYCHPESATCEYECALKRKAAMDRISSTPGILGVPVPKCDTDGSYGPIQCIGSMCQCVDKLGQGLHFGVGRGDTEGMNCNCEREKSDYTKSGLIGKMFRCKENGNYEDVQCLGSVCFCVDENGKQLENSPKVEIGKMDSMNC